MKLALNYTVINCAQVVYTGRFHLRLRGRVRGYQCGVAGFVQMWGLSKSGVIQISQNMSMRGLW